MAVLGASVSVATAQVNSISGSMDLQVELPDVLVLYHWQTVGIEFHSAIRNVAIGCGTGIGNFGRPDIEIKDNDSINGADLTDDQLVTTSTPNTKSENKISVTLKDAWAVRSISENGVKLSIWNSDDTHKSDSDPTSIVKTENVKVKSNGGSGPSIDLVDSKWTPTKGDITFDLNFEQVKKQGCINQMGRLFS
ncbi:hypothetical protein [Moraxella sp. ZY200743]|uniref:hypothetical protein n=1 Tax=Moraxella sp. ZY200743 TaxID=2911970 RepID=UPI003D7E9C67